MALVPVTATNEVQNTMSMATIETSPGMTKKQKHLEKVLKDIEKIKNSVVEQKEKKQLEEENKKAKQDKQNAQAKKKVDERRYEHGVFGGKGKSVDNTFGRKRQSIQGENQLQIKIIKPKDDISEIMLEDD